MQLIVLGMHRSGTSAVTRLLNMAGAYFGPEGISNGADEGNPKGFWERVDVRAACDGLLQESGFDWWKVADLSLDRISEHTRARHLDVLERILLELDAHRPWVVKEPRLSLLFPLVRPLLEVPVCIHVTREPLEIAASLHTRNGFPPPAGLALWELYTLHAIEASAGVPRLHVRCEDVMSAPVDTLVRLLDRLSELGVSGLRVPTEREITAYVDPRLHREHRSGGDRRLWLNDQQMALATAIDDDTALDGADLPRDVSDGARAQLRAFEESWAQRARGDQLQGEVDRLKDDIDRLEKEADQREDRLKSLRRQLDALDARGQSARSTLDSADRQLRSLATSRAWRLAWTASMARRRILRQSTVAVPEPIQSAGSIIDQARRQLSQSVQDPAIVGDEPEADGE